MIKSVISLFTAFVMTFVSLVPTVAPKTQSEKSYPYIFVHGFLGWGDSEGINEDIPYWGASSCDLLENLENEGYECYAASVGPLSSNWDRACELYAQLTGSRVDYGAAHSAAHNHARYGRTYAKPTFEGWGTKDKDGRINKINLIGHSLGGNTVRLLLGLLADGSAEEQKATPSDDISPLFLGGKGDWVNAMVTICSPNNGTTLAFLAQNLHLIVLLKAAFFTWARIWGRNDMVNGYFDFHLEQFGLTDIPGGEKSSKSLKDTLEYLIKKNDDSVVSDLSPDGVEKLNETIGIEDSVYYFSYPFSTAKQSKLTGCFTPLPSTLAILAPLSLMMCGYSKNIATDYPIDKSWLDNDGMVNVISAKAPFDDPSTNYNPNKVEAGIWNVMPVSTGDHGNAIGINTTEKATMDFYNGIMEMIEALPVTS